MQNGVIERSYNTLYECVIKSPLNNCAVLQTVNIYF